MDFQAEFVKLQDKLNFMVRNLVNRDPDISK